MKPYQRRQQGGYPYYKLAKWDARSMTWCDGRGTHTTEADAFMSITIRGRYRISEVTECGRRDLPPFDVVAVRPYPEAVPVT